MVVSIYVPRGGPEMIILAELCKVDLALGHSGVSGHMTVI